MVKRVIRRKSSARRVSARPLGVNSRGEPLGFWHFIRKNFLIIAGLLLLPVTVGAVLSSYGTFSGASSAATLNTQDMNLRTLGNTCTDRGLTDRSNVRVLEEGEVNCKGGVLWYEKTCSVCHGGKMESCTQPDQFAICDMTPPPAGNSCSQPSTPNQQYACVPAAKLCRFCNNGQWRDCDDGEKQEKCGISIPICSNYICEEGENSTNCPTDCPSSEPTPTQVKKQPTIVIPSGEPSKPTPVKKECDKLDDRYNVGGCGENSCKPNEKMKCTYYTKDETTGECGGKDCACEADASCPGGQGGSPQPTTGGGGEGGTPGCLRCFAGECNDGWKYGSDTCAPQQTCDQRRQDACSAHGGFKQNLGGLSAGGFDMQKALKNFFGIFGF